MAGVDGIQRRACSLVVGCDYRRRPARIDSWWWWWRVICVAILGRAGSTVHQSCNDLFLVYDRLADSGWSMLLPRLGATKHLPILPPRLRSIPSPASHPPLHSRKKICAPLEANYIARLCSTELNDVSQRPSSWGLSLFTQYVISSQRTSKSTLHTVAITRMHNVHTYVLLMFECAGIICT